MNGASRLVDTVEAKPLPPEPRVLRSRPVSHRYSTRRHPVSERECGEKASRQRGSVGVTLREGQTLLPVGAAHGAAQRVDEFAGSLWSCAPRAHEEPGVQRVEEGGFMGRSLWAASEQALSFG